GVGDQRRLVGTLGCLRSQHLVAERREEEDRQGGPARSVLLAGLDVAEELLEPLPEREARLDPLGQTAGVGLRLVAGALPRDARGDLPRLVQVPVPELEAEELRAGLEELRATGSQGLLAGSTATRALEERFRREDPGGQVRRHFRMEQG